MDAALSIMLPATQEKLHRIFETIRDVLRRPTVS